MTTAIRNPPDMRLAMGSLRTWLIRAAIGGGLLLYAALATASAFDRSARKFPGLADWVPAGLQAAAPSARARQFIEAGLPAPALDPARAALRADPVDPASTALYGTALLARGVQRSADDAFRVGARLGWREPLTQLYWMETALAANDARAAVLRFDALARQYPEAPAMAQASARLEASEAGRAALAARMAQGTNWAGSYAQIDGSAGADQVVARGDVLAAAARLGLKLGCEPIARITRALAEVDPQRGAALWREHCPDAGSAGVIADGGFEKFVPARQRVPFEWMLAGHGDLSAAIVPAEPAGSGQALKLANGGTVNIPVLTQFVPLPPGRYRIAWAGANPSRLRAELSCARQPAVPPVETGSGKIFEVDASCPARWLRFWLTPGATPVLLDEVTLERL